MSRCFISYMDARDLVLETVSPVEAESVPLEAAAGRVLARDAVAGENVPSFDRSPYDGYAVRACDTACAAPDFPVQLHILEEIPAGGVSHIPLTRGTAAKVLTGAPIPEGADAVVMFEQTEFTKETVTLRRPVGSGTNIVRAGEDIRAGSVLAAAGTMIDAGLVGTLAAQNIPEVAVYRRPRVGIISTGSEILELGMAPEPGKIYNSNRYTLHALVQESGCEAVYLGTAGDCAEEIRDLILAGLEHCDGLVLTGGVSVGDYDLTPAAMEMAGAAFLFRGVAIKPGMACAYGVKNGRLICALSGNPASAVTNFHAVARPALRKLCGHRNCLPEEVTVVLDEGFKKRSPGTRLLRGILDGRDGTVRMRLPGEQGNVVLSSVIGCNVMAVIPAGSGPVEPGTELKGFLLKD